MIRDQHIPQPKSQQDFRRHRPGHLNPDRKGVRTALTGNTGRKPSVLRSTMPIQFLSHLVFSEPSGRIRTTYSPCPSRFAATHIKGEFFFFAPPNSSVEEQT